MHVRALQLSSDMQHSKGRKVMNDFSKMAEENLKEINNIIHKAEKDATKVPYGALNTVRRGNIFQYYYKSDDKNSKRTYLKRSEEKFARSLAQRDFANAVLKVARHDKMCLTKTLQVHELEDYMQMYQKLPDARNRLVTSYVMSDDEYAQRWLENENKRKVEDADKVDNLRYFKLPDAEDAIITEKGEIVRSKSEKILADKLYMLNVPYVYEVPLMLRGLGYVIPDFITLNKRTRKSFYLEHFGLMDQPQYMDKAIKKIELYEKNNIFPGDGLLITYETENHTLNIQTAEILIRKFLL